MCLGIPGQVVRMLDGYNDQVALVDVVGEQRKVNVGMLPEETFAPGDWVIIHMGFVCGVTMNDSVSRVWSSATVRRWSSKRRAAAMTAAPGRDDHLI